MWRQSDEATRRRYQKQYQSDQAEYEQKMTAYRAEKNKKPQSSKSKKGDNNNNNNEETMEYNDQS